MAIPAILKGDTSANIVLAIAAGYDYTGCTLAVVFNGVTKEFADLEAGGTKSLAYTADETAGMPLGTAHATMTLTNSDGTVRTMPWVKIRVTDMPGEIYDRTIDVDPSQLDVADATASDSLGTVKSKLNAVLAFLRGGAACLLCCLGLAAFGDLGPTSMLDDVPGDTTISNLVAASCVTIGGVVQQGVTTNAVYGIITNNVDSGYLCTVASADAKYLPMNGGTMRGDLSILLGHRLLIAGDTSGAYIGITNNVGICFFLEGDGITSRKSVVCPDDSPVATSNMVNGIVAGITADSIGAVGTEQLTNTALRVASRTWDTGYQILWEKIADKGGFYEVCVTNVDLEVQR